MRDSLGSQARLTVLVPLLLGLLALLVAMVALAHFNMWALRPVVYDSLAIEGLSPLVRSWGPWLAERGRVVIRHADTEVEVELRKHRFATRPDELHFRVRNADATRPHFRTIRAAFEQAGVTCQLETTPKRKQPRAIAICLAAEDIHTPAAACNLIQIAFKAVGATEPRWRAYCDGAMRNRPDVPSVLLLPWRQDYQLGFSTAILLGRARKWWRGPK
jgi:hypothetical protein